MSDRRFHLGWFTYFGQNAWNEPLGLPVVRVQGLGPTEVDSAPLQA